MENVIEIRQRKKVSKPLKIISQQVQEQEQEQAGAASGEHLQPGRSRSRSSRRMEDEVEEHVVVQVMGAGLKLAWRSCRPYAPRPELVALAFVAVLLLFHVRSVDIWGRALLARLSATSPLARRGIGLNLGVGDLVQWQDVAPNTATYALQGRRPRMEDRFVQLPDLRGCGADLYAIFDGHGGELAAEFAKESLIKSLSGKICDIKDIISGKKQPPPEEKPSENKPQKEENPQQLNRNKSFKKTTSTTDDASKKEITDPDLLNLLKLKSPITRDVQPKSTNVETAKVPLSDYIQSGKINYGKLIADEILAADDRLIVKAKKSFDIAGTTALIAVVENDILTVANVGDSRGVMCDRKGNAIPLSFDHKPQQMRERKRIREAGGFIGFNGVWRVAGILATSRAMGDYPLKDKKYVIADPDVLTFDLSDHKPLFFILATDGLWDTFSNEEAVNYIKDHLDEPLFGAQSLAVQSYKRGSDDNITIMVVNLRDKQYAVSSEKNPNL